VLAALALVVLGAIECPPPFVEVGLKAGIKRIPSYMECNVQSLVLGM